MNTDLNNDIFPLHYNGPYPITRGIQVETGAIIIICAMGILSQAKVWKIIRRRQEEKAREQRQRDDEGNMADEEHGRRVEDGIKRERGSWEVAYGSGDRGKHQHPDSGIGTEETDTRKGSESINGTSNVRGSGSEGIELHEMDDSSHVSKEDGRLIVNVMQDDEISPVPSETHLARVKGDSRDSSIHESQVGAPTPSGADASLRKATVVRSIDEKLTLKPKITHLPFRVPEPDSGTEDGRSSVAASAASEYMTDRWSKRFPSSSSLARKGSKRSRRSFVAASTSDEALMVPDIEDDRASSIAATIDGVSEKDDMEDETTSVRDQRPSFEILREQGSMQALIKGTQPTVNLAQDADELPGQGAGQVPVDGDHVEAAQHINALIEPRPESVALPDSDVASTIDARSNIEESNSKSRANVASKSEASEKSLRINRLSTNLPEGASRVVTAYRTNEWAKHLEAADLPEIDELEVKKNPASDSPAERVAPVDVRALQQTPVTAEPAPMLTTAKRSVNDRPESYSQSKNSAYGKQDLQHRNSTMHQLTREKAIERLPSQTYLAHNMERSSSQTSLDSIKSRKEQYRPPLPKFRSSQSSLSSARGLRSSSSPILSSPLVASPIEEGVEASFPPRFAPSSTHLMSQRDSMIRNRPSSTSLLRTSWSNASLDQPQPPLHALPEDENISLSQRRSLLQQHRHSAPRLHRSSSGPVTSGPVTPVYAHPPSHTYRAPTPQPLSAHPSYTPFPRDSTLSAWRASLQPSTTAHYRDVEIENRRASLMDEKRRESTSRQEVRARESQSQLVRERGMRKGSMLELHQAQMRKMQAEANRSLQA